MCEVKKKLRILLVDDHPIVRQGLATFLNQEADLSVAGEAESAPEAVHKLEREPFDLAVIDVSLQSSNGIELVKTIRARGIGVPVLVLSMHDEALYAERAVRAGANGYVMKSAPSETILRAMRAVIRGDLFVSDEIAGKLLRKCMHPVDDESKAGEIATLSDRELEVLELIGLGNSVKDIAEKLHIGTKTVETHRSHIRQKLGLTNGSAVIRRAVLWVNGNGTAD